MFHVVFCFFSIMGVKVQINLVGDSYLYISSVTLHFVLRRTENRLAEIEKSFG